MRRQSVAATALSPGTNGFALIHASPKAVSRCACPRTPKRARTSQAPSNIAKRLDCERPYGKALTRITLIVEKGEIEFVVIREIRVKPLFRVLVYFAVHHSPVEVT